MSGRGSRQKGGRGENLAKQWLEENLPLEDLGLSAQRTGYLQRIPMPGNIEYPDVGIVDEENQEIEVAIEVKFHKRDPPARKTLEQVPYGHPVRMAMLKSNRRSWIFVLDEADAKMLLTEHLKSWYGSRNEGEQQ